MYLVFDIYLNPSQSKILTVLFLLKVVSIETFFGKNLAEIKI